jgi:hypothetical protein
MEKSRRFLFLLAMSLVFVVAEVVSGAVTYTLGPDVIPDGPATPYTFSNTADGYGYDLVISPNPTPAYEWHVPVFTLTNTSTNVWADLIHFQFTIGDRDYNFDHLGIPGRDTLGAFTMDLNNDGVYSYWSPDNQDGVIRADALSYGDYAGFDIGDVFVFLADIDVDTATYPGSVEDFRTVFWYNGGALNSAITVTFIPEPATLCLLGVGSLGLFCVRGRRSRR